MAPSSVRGNLDFSQRLMFRRFIRVRHTFTLIAPKLISALTVKARAVYAYTGENPDELTVDEGAEVTVVDQSDSEWWKAEKNGAVLIVPAAYLEVVEG